MRSMAEAAAHGYSGDEYFALVDKGILEPDDRVELLGGMIVAMSPRSAARLGVAQDRLTKGALYAAAGIPEPDSPARRYAERRIATRQDTLDIIAFSDVRLRVDDLIPARD